MADTKQAAAGAASPVYVVAVGEIPGKRDPKSRIRAKATGVGESYAPASADEAAELVARGIIVTKEEFAARTNPLAAELIDAANKRAEKAEAELAKLKAPPQGQT